MGFHLGLDFIPLSVLFSLSLSLSLGSFILRPRFQPKTFLKLWKDSLPEMHLLESMSGGGQPQDITNGTLTNGVNGVETMKDEGHEGPRRRVVVVGLGMVGISFM